MEYKAILIDKKIHGKLKAKLVNKNTIKEVVESLILNYLNEKKNN